MQAFQRTQLVHRRRRRRLDRTESSRRPFRLAGLGLTALVLVGVALLAGGIGLAYFRITADLPPVTALPVYLDPQHGTLLQPTRLYDRSGEYLLTTLENPGIERRMLPLNPAMPGAISPILTESVVQLVEPDYWEAPLLDLRGLLEDRPPGIAERLVTRLLLPETPQNMAGSVRARLLTGNALSQYGRAQVLEWYLNSASFGHLTFGVDSAARLYLGKSASQVDWYEAALLIAALEAPALNPLDAPAAAHERQLDVLASMAAAGMISQAELELGRNMPMLEPPPLPEESPLAVAFTGLVVERLEDEIGRPMLERGGLKIITTLDVDLQRQLNCTLQAQLTRLAGGSSSVASCPEAELLPPLPLSAPLPEAAAQLSASAALLDPTGGQVLALVGDTSLIAGESPQKTHPSGSVQTPFLALAAFARGMSPASLVWDLPPGETETSTATADYHGPVRLRTALANDYLAALTQVLEQIGVDTLITTEVQLGISAAKLPPEGMGVLHGGAELTPLDVAFAYSVFSTLGQQTGWLAPDGEGMFPQVVRAVENSAGDRVDIDLQTETRAVVSPQLAYLVHHVLADEPARRPSLGYPNPLEIGRPAGAKAGSADSGRSTWAAGYTRQAAGAIWLGYADDAQTPAAPLDVNFAAGIWQAMMQYASRDQPVLGWEMPPGLVSVEVCEPSGLLPTVDCPNVVPELFLAENLPTATDTLYRRYAINRETGRLATVFTPPELVDEAVFLVVPPEAESWSRLVNLPVPPQDYDAIYLPPPDETAQVTSPVQFSYVRGKVRVLGTAAGENFSSYSLQLGQGINPERWLTVTGPVTTPVKDGLLGEIDTSGMEGLYIVRLLVVQQDRLVKTGLLQITVDNTPPEVSLPYPLHGQVFSGALQRTITLQSETWDAVGIQRVEWWVDGRKIGERTLAPFAWVWDAPAGSHLLQLRAFDLAGNVAQTEEIEIEVR